MSGGATPARRAVALLISEPGRERPPSRPGRAVRWLTVRRPDDDPDLPGVWGLPAGSCRAGESVGDLVRRIGRDKLGIETADLGCVGKGDGVRGARPLSMRLHAAKLGPGEPRVPQLVPGVTQYVEWAWNSPEALRAGAAKGSLCCRLALRAVDDEEDAR